ncbi:MAG: hypothetical protein JWP22_216, partial [Ramlibacter sp.]|nr:hypothetical protein [Ramlibacter sp.]
AFPASSYTFDDQRRETLNHVETKLTGTEGSMLWMLGAQVERRELAVANTTGAVHSDLDATLDRRVLWGQNEWEVFKGSTLTAGLRGETLRIASGSSTLVLADRSSNFLQPSLHLRTPLSEDMQFRANLARITRNPRIWDLIDRTIISQGRNSLANPDYVGNPALAPEHSWTLDTGVERRLAGEGQAGLNLFVRRVSDAIATVASFTGSRWVEQRINAGDATVWGLEADVKSGLAWAGLARDWTLSAHASLLQSRMTSGANEGNRIPGQPRYTASVTVAKPLRRTGGFFGGATLGLTGASDFNTSPGITGRERSRAQLDVYVGSVLPTLGYWRVGVFNVTDAPFDRVRNYTDSAGGPGSSSSHTVLTPRLYLTVGTQF